MLAIWIENQVQRNSSANVMPIKAKVSSLFEGGNSTK
jgi:hypothetical protein